MSSFFERAGPVEHLLQELRAKDIRLWIEGADLRVSAPPGVLTAALREDLSRRKAELLAHLQAGGGEGSTGDVAALVRVAQERDLPLSFAQERMWFLQSMDPEANPYRVEMLFALRADEADLQRAWNTLLDRHEILRTTYRMNDEGRLVQIVHASQRVELPVVDLSGVAETELAPEMRNRARDFVRMPFDLKQGPIWRILVFSLHDGLLGVALCIHHIASDGWSINSLVDELKKLCSAHAEGRTPQLAELPVQYADYAIWQRQWLQGERLARELDYWRQRLAGMPMVLDLPLDYPRPAVQTFEGAGCALDLPEAVAAGIGALGQRHRVTLFMTLLAVFKVLLFRYTGQTDIVVGAPIAGRDRPEIEHVQGLFLNTLVLRTELSGELRFSELLARVRDTTLGAYAHQDLPFEKLVDEIHLQRDLSRNPLYQATFNKPIVLAANPEARQAGLEISANKISGINADVQVDLSLTAHERSGSIALGLGYNTALFRQETIERMLVHYRMLLERAVDEPEAPIGELPLLTESERRQLLFDWNRTERAYPRVAGVHELFECQAAATPDAVAAASEAGQLSYGQLNERANRLAHHLRGLGVGEGVLVGLCVERSLDMLVGILGIVKAGGAYVPLDPDYPAERLSYMLEDAGAPVVITQSGALQRLPETAARIVCMDRDWPAIEACSGENPEITSNAASLAYLIYTSGSTGRPKGVPITHASLSNLIHWHQQAYEVTAADRATQIASPAFDASVWEIWPYLTAGASVHLVDEATRLDPGRLVQWLDEQRISLSFLPTPLAEAVLRETWPRQSALRVLLTGGDRLGQRPAQPLPFRLVNHYGPTENTVVSTCCEVQSTGTSLAAPPIGRPLPNTRAYIVDRSLQPVPVGVPGELLVGGVQLSAGYWNRPELTAEKFIADPFSTMEGARLYRTGDLVRYRTDGNIEFLGRIDDQVKVRGFRIEPGEIEAALRQQALVREAVVVVREDEPGDKRLVAYIVADGAAADVVESLRAQLRAILPDYMVPSAFVTLEQLPLTPNGKVDRKALPAPEYASAIYVAPRTPTEEILAGIWAEVLKLERVGVHDNFFELGGHSLLATQVVSRVRQALVIDLPLRELFAAPTIAEFGTRLLAWQTGPTFAVVPPLVASGEYGPAELSFAQQRLWILDQLDPGGAAYVIAGGVELSGSLDVPALERTLEALVKRHDSLRTVFEIVQGEPRQVVSEPVAWTLPMVDLASRIQARERLRDLLREEAAHVFDLAHGPLFRARLFRLEEGTHVLLLAMHHIISDGWSLGVLTRELSALYRGFALGKESALPELRLRYRDFARWHRNWLQAEVLEGMLMHWREKLSGAPQVLDLPIDRPRPAVESFRGASYSFTLPPELTEALRALSRREGTTLFMTLLSGFALLLSRYSGQQDLLIGTPVANRNRAEIEGLIGFFVNTLVLRADLSGDPSAREFLGRMREVCLDAYAHQDLPFERLVEALRPTRDLSRNAVFQVMFTLQNAPMEVLELPGLTLRPVQLDTGTAKFDLTLAVQETPDILIGGFSYSTDLFDQSTIVRMAAHWCALLEAMAATPERSIAEFPLLTESERQQLLLDWNQTDRDYPRDASVAELFERQARRAPDAVAVEYGDERLSYGELNSRANRLAHHLRGMGVGPEVLVGLLMERSLAAVVAMLGILKAGGAYVPLDPEYPAERLAFMLVDTETPLVVTQSEWLDRLPQGEARIVCLDRDWPEIEVYDAQDQPASGAGAENLAYVIYTSGSTGTPKGVQVTNRAISRLVCNTDYVQVGPADRFAQVSVISFDAATFEIWGALLNGARVIGVSREVSLNLQGFAAHLRESGITVLFLTTALFNHMTREVPGVFKTLRYVLFGGEAVDPGAVRAVLCDSPPQHLLHVYGPTEMTTYSTWHHVTEVDEAALTVPIGRPIANTTAYVLDGHLAPVPVGVVGELYLGGDGLARGYLNRAELTARHFVANPFSAEPGARLYRTGDWVRYREDGAIEFVGRRDDQVKLRGFRIELGEIEAALRQQALVREAVVVVREDEPGDKRLVAYIVADGAAADVVESLRAQLRSSLPDYMVPSAFVTLEQLPLTPNGKVDRKALPAPERESQVGAEYVAPGNGLEQELAAVWQEVLRMEKVGVDDNFFDLGGNSLLVTRVHARIKPLFQREVRVVDLFRYPTIRLLASALSDDGTAHSANQNRIQERAGKQQHAMRMLQDRRN